MNACAYPMKAIRFADNLDLVHEHWSPKIIAEMNDYQFKVVKILGDFVWHTHADTDEAFIVIKGLLRIDYRDDHVLLGPGEMFVVPRGTEHKTYADSETELLLIEPRDVVNTGDEPHARAAKNGRWI